MKFEEMTLREYLTELGAGTAVPGGGNVAALCGALAAALSTMVAKLTLGREKYRPAWEEVGAANDKAEELRERLIALAQEDSDAYLKVMAGYQLPKTTEAEKARRNEAIQAGLKAAAHAPLETLRAMDDLMSLADTVLRKGNPNTLTDAGAAIHLVHSAAYIAAANVRINLASIDDKVFCAESRNEVQNLLESIEARFHAACEYFESRLP